MLLSFLLVWLSGVAGTVVRDAVFRNQPWHVRSLVDEAALGQRHLFHISFDTNGMIRISASTGLYEYDGYRWSRRTTRDGLPSNFVRCTFRDSRGDLWVGTDRGAGVLKAGMFDPRGSGSRQGMAGQSIRRIREDPDGTLWFCADRWLRPEEPGGLYELRSEKWIAHGIENGLPSDHLIDYFRSSAGRRFSLTSRGAVEQRNDRWEAIREPGFLKDELTWMILEETSGGLLSFTATNLLRLTEGRWKSIPATPGAMCTTREGDVVSFEMEPGKLEFRFTVWNGSGFEPKSAPAPAGTRFIEMLAQAPDGAIWAVGQGTLVRWDYRGGAWSFHPGLPIPRLVDRQGQLWLADASTLYRRVVDGFEKMDFGQAPLVEDSQGRLWFATTDGIASMDSGGSQARAIPVQGMKASAVAQDSTGEVWFAGTTPDQKLVVARSDRGEIVLHSLNSPPVSEVLSVSADPDEGIWLTARLPATNRFLLAQATREGIKPYNFEGPQPPVDLPRVGAGKDSLWLYGYSGVYRTPKGLGGRSAQESFLPHLGIKNHLISPGLLVFAYAEGVDGRSGFSMLLNGEQLSINASVASGILEKSNGTLLLGGNGSLHVWRRRQSEQVAEIFLPVQLHVEGVVEDPKGTLWIGTEQGLFEYQAPRYQPGTRVSLNSTEIRNDGILEAVFSAIQPMGPVPQPGTHRFSWRINQGAWSTENVENRLRMQVYHLEPGVHELEVRAHELFGSVDATPERVSFTVLPVPLQDRPWFRPAVACWILIMLTLFWVTLHRAWQLKKVNELLEAEVQQRRTADSALRTAQQELEKRVDERTHDLEVANINLKKEVQDRLRAEEEVRSLNTTLEQRVAERTAELAAANNELQAFSYSVSHDLRSPLRAIDGFTYAAIEDSEGTLSPASRKHLDRVRAAVQHMGRLIDGLLHLSKSTLGPMNRAEVDLSAIARQIGASLQSAAPQRRVDFVVRDSLVCAADEMLMRVVMENLLGNAWKYSRNTTSARIEVGREILNEEEVFFVRDNGVGFDMNYAQRLFQVFQRLHHQDQFEGTGVGLATVQRIVARHGGRIWAEARPGQGAVFRFTLTPPTRPATL